MTLYVSDHAMAETSKTPWWATYAILASIALVAIGVFLIQMVPDSTLGIWLSAIGGAAYISSIMIARFLSDPAALALDAETAKRIRKTAYLLVGFGSLSLAYNHFTDRTLLWSIIILVLGILAALASWLQQFAKASNAVERHGQSG